MGQYRPTLHLLFPLGQQVILRPTFHAQEFIFVFHSFDDDLLLHHCTEENSKFTFVKPFCDSGNKGHLESETCLWFDNTSVYGTEVKYNLDS